MQNHSVVFFIVRIFLLALVYGQAIFAADKITNQETVVVTATRFETSIETAPVNTTVINAEDINRSSATNLSQALEILGGVYIKDLFGLTGSKASADMGGFGASGGSNTLILLNGRRLNDTDLSGVNLETIPLNAVAKIEIVHGNASVLYGDNATAGVINIVTKSGFDDSAIKWQLDRGSYNTQGMQIVASESASNTAALVSINTMTSDGYRDNNASDKKNALADFSLSTDSGIYGIRLMTSGENLELPGSLDEATYINDRTASNPSIEFINEDRTTAELYFQQEKFAAELAYRTREQGSYLFGDITSDLETLSFTPRYSTSFGHHNLVTGADLYNSRLKVNSDFSAFASLNKNNTERKSVALYASDTIALGNSTSLNAGIRRQRVNIDIANTDVTNGIDTSDDRQDTLNAWDVTLNHRFNQDMKTYVRYARGMRFPVLDEMWTFFDGSINLLEPQTSTHLEAGFNTRIGTSSHLSLTIFQIEIKDEIGYDVATFSNVNFDNTTHRGLDVNYQTLINKMWKMTAAANWREATFSEGIYKGNDIPENPQLHANLNQSFDITQHQNIDINVVYTGTRYFGDDYSNQGKKMGGYTMLNAQYQKLFDSWFLKFKINNLTNKKAADYGLYVDSPFVPDPYFYYPLPERTILLSIGLVIN